MSGIRFPNSIFFNCHLVKRKRTRGLIGHSGRVPPYLLSQTSTTPNYLKWSKMQIWIVEPCWTAFLTKMKPLKVFWWKPSVSHTILVEMALSCSESCSVHLLGVETEHHRTSWNIMEDHGRSWKQVQHRGCCDAFLRLWWTSERTIPSM